MSVKGLPGLPAKIDFPKDLSTERLTQGLRSLQTALEKAGPGEASIEQLRAAIGTEGDGSAAEILDRLRYKFMRDAGYESTSTTNADGTTSVRDDPKRAPAKSLSADEVAWAQLTITQAIESLSAVAGVDGFLSKQEARTLSLPPRDDVTEFARIAANTATLGWVVTAPYLENEAKVRVEIDRHIEQTATELGATGLASDLIRAFLRERSVSLIESPGPSRMGELRSAAYNHSSSVVGVQYDTNAESNLHEAAKGRLGRLGEFFTIRASEKKLSPERVVETILKTMQKIDESGRPDETAKRVLALGDADPQRLLIMLNSALDAKVGDYPRYVAGADLAG